MNASGYLVVRRPDWNEALPDGPILERLNATPYCGIDRCEWIDLFDQDYYRGALPAALQGTVGQLEAQRAFKSGLLLLDRLENALELLDYSNRRADVNEVIAVRFASPNAPPVSIADRAQVEWIGFDVYAEAQWSLIARGLFTRSSHFEAWRARVNRFGLFECIDSIVPYEKDYRSLVMEGVCEELAGPEAGFGIIGVEIGRVS